MAISNVFLKKNVFLSVCLTLFESADARDLGLMTLFLHALKRPFIFQDVEAKEISVFY